LFLAGIPAGIATVSSVVATGTAIVSTMTTINGYYQSYARNKARLEQATAFLQPLVGAIAPIVSKNDKIVDPTGYASTLMSAVLVWKGWGWVSRLFAKKYGHNNTKELSDLTEYKLKNAIVVDDAITAKHLRKLAKTPPHWLKDMPLDNKIIMGTALSVLASYLHSEGAETMKMHARAMKVDYEHPVEAGLASDDLGLPSLKRMCYNLYLNNDYYTNPQSQIGLLSTPFNNHIVRIIANTFIGLFQQMGILSNEGDPIDAFVTAAELVGYWEVTAHLIGLYGWAPVYVATHWVMESMFARAPKSRKK
jgi:hypothetical protein